MRKIFKVIFDWVFFIAASFALMLNLGFDIHLYGWYSIITFPLKLAISFIALAVLLILWSYLIYILGNKKFIGLRQYLKTFNKKDELL